MKIEEQILPLKHELESLVSSSKEAMDEQRDKLQKLIEEVSEFDRNWIGAWATNRYNLYNNFTKRGKEQFTTDEEGIIAYIEKKSGVKLKDIENAIPKISKAHRDFKDKVVTELSVIKGMEPLQPEIELLDKIEKHKWGMSASDFIKMKRPQSIITYNPASILNKGLDTPPHIGVGGDLMSVFSTLAAMEDFQKNVKRLIRQLELKLSLEKSATSKSDFIIKMVNNFHNVSRQILNRYSKRETITINDEYDVQDLFHALLRIEFSDIRAEEYTPSYAGSATRMDFLLKAEKTVVEIKKTRDNLRDKEVGDQLIIDVQHYKAHPDCKRLICFVYDPENKIRNPRGLETDLNSLSSDELIVEVYIRP